MTIVADATHLLVYTSQAGGMSLAHMLCKLSTFEALEFRQFQ